MRLLILICEIIDLRDGIYRKWEIKYVCMSMIIYIDNMQTKLRILIYILLYEVSQKPASRYQ